MNGKPENITRDAWDSVDSPELTEDELARMKPAREALKPALFEKLTKGRGPQKTPTKEAVSLRLDRDVVEHFRSMGPGWQTKINDILRERAALPHSGTKAKRTKTASPRPEKKRA